MNHPFVDGNKRTGISAALVFLEENKYKLDISRGMIEEFALEIVHQRLDIPQIAKWLEKNSKK